LGGQVRACAGEERPSLFTTSEMVFHLVFHPSIRSPSFICCDSSRKV